MTTLHRIMDVVCRALTTSGVARWEGGESVMVAEAQEIELGRQGADRAPRAISLQQFNYEMPSSIPLAELALINDLDETARLRAGQAVKRVTGTVTPSAN